MTDRRNMFGTIAASYDMVNVFLTCGISYLWYETLAKKVLLHLRKDSSISLLDLCCGTGTASKTIYKKALKKNLSPPKITGIDFSPHMLFFAKKANIADAVFLQADAEALPCDNESFDVVCLAFGYRNIVTKEKVLSEIVRILKKNGTVYIMELFSPNFLLLRSIYFFYMKKIAPWIGKLCSGHKDPYIYLADSIQNFSLKESEKTIANAGFRIVEKKLFLPGCCVLLKMEHE